ncbi:MAG: 2Fe-2S iron-sulfur cluster binding domain-containing protein [bacterium]|nr:2Fe-2S iron-sulfur cluster binding domain-containing protein [bacterium]
MKKTIRCIVNNREVETSLAPGNVTLDLIREHLKLPGTKEGCREGECGACTVLIGEHSEGNVTYKTVASCLLPLGDVHGKHIVTVEGLNNETLTPVQQALVEEGAVQCGYCTPGLVLSLTGFLLNSENREYSDAIDAIDGNICRCTGYVSIRNAARKLSDTYAAKPEKDATRVENLVADNVLPGYFKEIPQKLQTILDETKAPPAKKKAGSVIVAGGTDIFVQKPLELLEENLEFISQRSGMTGISKENGTVSIGAGTTVEELKHSPVMQELYPTIKKDLNLISSTIMRNRATVGGNIVNASPIGDITIILLALDASIRLVKGNSKRNVPLKKFFKGYKQMDLRKGELIETVMFPVPAENSRFNFEKVSQRTYLDIASCNTAATITSDGNLIQEIVISAGGVAPVPSKLTNTCAYLKGKEITTATLQEALTAMEGEIAPISDVRGSADYKKKLLRNLVTAHFVELFPEKELI